MEIGVADGTKDVDAEIILNGPAEDTILEHDVIFATFVFRWPCSCKYRSALKVRQTTLFFFSFRFLIYAGRSRRAPQEITVIAFTV